jgi:hypothetical protein
MLFFPPPRFPATRQEGFDGTNRRVPTPPARLASSHIAIGRFQRNSFFYFLLFFAGENPQTALAISRSLLFYDFAFHTCWLRRHRFRCRHHRVHLLPHDLCDEEVQRCLEPSRLFSALGSNCKRAPHPLQLTFITHDFIITQISQTIKGPRRKRKRERRTGRCSDAMAASVRSQPVETNEYGGPELGQHDRISSWHRALLREHLPGLLSEEPGVGVPSPGGSTEIPLAEGTMLSPEERELVLRAAQCHVAVARKLAAAAGAPEPTWAGPSGSPTSTEPTPSPAEQEAYAIGRAIQRTLERRIAEAFQTGIGDVLVEFRSIVNGLDLAAQVPASSRWLSTAAIAARLSLDEVTVARLCKKRLIDATKTAGGKWRTTEDRLRRSPYLNGTRRVLRQRSE